MNWYLLQIKPNLHTIAIRNLKNQGFEIFFPLLAKTSKKNKKFTDTTSPLFPGYLFFGTEAAKVPWKSINGTRGVSKAVTLDGIYRKIDFSIIEGLRNRCDENGVIRVVDELVFGDRVKVERGPFADFICSVEKITDSRRAWVLIELLQQQTRTQISMDNLSKID